MTVLAYKTELMSPVRAVSRVTLSHHEPAADIDPAILSSLVGAIYDAALAPDQWPQVLDGCRRFVGGMSGNLFAKDSAGIAGGIFHTDGNMDMAYGQLYFERYARLDPVTGGHLLTALDEPVGTADLMDIDEFRTSRFYREWAEPQGIVDMVSAPIQKDGNWAAMFGVFLHASQGMTDETTKHRMRLLVPHIRRAVVIGEVIERSNFQAASLGDAFDGLSVGMFLIGADGRVVHANAAGQAMYGGGAIDTTRDGRIVTAGPEATKALAEVFAAAAKGDEAVGVRGISVALAGPDGDNHVAHILPLTSGTRRRTGIRYAAVAAMFVQRASLAIPAAPEVIARTFGLTLSELRVMSAIVKVGGVTETADALGIGEATVKTHLHKVFAKTGTARQADLVRLAAGFASPLAS